MYHSDNRITRQANLLTGCYEDRQLQSFPSSLKAHVGQYVCGNRTLIIKSYDHAHPLLRSTVCRILLHREQKALLQLQGVPGVPKFYGRHGKHALAMAYISGRHPNRRDLESWSSFDDQLTRTVSLLHDRGVTHNDLRLHNMIIDAENTLHLIDFASVHFKPIGKGLLSLPGRFLFSKLTLTDTAKVLRLRTQEATAVDRLNKAEQQLLKRANRLRIWTQLWKRHVVPLLRKTSNRA